MKTLHVATYYVMLLATCTSVWGQGLGAYDDYYDDDGSFGYCNQSPFEQTVDAQSSTWLLVWDNAGSSFNQSCLLVSVNSGTTAVQSGLELSMGCSPYWEDDGPWTVLKKLDYFATQNTEEVFNCPVEGYFYLFVYNPFKTSVSLQFEQSGTLYGSDGMVKQARPVTPRGKAHYLRKKDRS
eukprot:gb/GECG01000318.1/.p1 GENE.gb/GECG01000318.1/~~gb/GECG01000318.1/.p1  ORF type:complete len:181 (+),score=22.57 gb/GECG01000318.1/:1-543(+)